jgi:crotonobetaine/carnitine-CoA ligase
MAAVPDAEILPQLIHARAASAEGGRPFLIQVGGDTYSYAEADLAAREWAKSFDSLGVEKGARVAVMVPTSNVAFLIWLACGWLHAYDVPVHVQYRGAILRHILNNSGAHVLVIRADLLDALWDVVEELDALKAVVVVPAPDGNGCWRNVVPSNWRRRIHDSADLKDGAILAENGPRHFDIGAIVYTSGTTGPAKGVLVPWRLFHRHAQITIPLTDIGSDDCYYCPLPLSHIAGRVGIYNMALVGGRAVLRERFSVEAYWEDVATHGCTSTILMGASAEMLWRRPPSPNDAETPLRNVLMGPLIPQVEEFKRRFGVRVRTQFGMTEASPPLKSGVANDWDLFDSQSCGRLVEGYQCRVADENDEPLGPGQIGELLIRTDEPWLLMAGYWRDPEGTATALRNQWFHTGDAVRYDEDGNFYYVDRIKDTIRRRGENISSFFVEQAINEHPAVMESAVVGVVSAFTEQEIHAFVVPKPGVTVDGEQIRDFLKSKLAVFMIPRFWTLVPDLPRTSTQRVRKVELRAMAEAEHRA